MRFPDGNADVRPPCGVCDHPEMLLDQLVDATAEIVEPMPQRGEQLRAQGRQRHAASLAQRTVAALRDFGRRCLGLPRRCGRMHGIEPAKRLRIVTEEDGELVMKLAGTFLTVVERLKEGVLSGQHESA